jgi:uncharacterized protein
MQKIKIINKNKSSLPAIDASLCDTFLCKLKGYMFTPSLGKNDGLLFTLDREQIINASIHMFFMNFDIAVIWLNSDFKIVDMRYARRWHPAYFPAAPARYILETNPLYMEEYNTGDQLEYV